MKNVLSLIDKSGSFRIYLAISTDMVEEARKIHNLSPVCTAGVGRVLTGAGLMGIQLKNDSDKLSLIFKGDGPIGKIIATSKRNGEVKGYCLNPDVELPLNSKGKLDVGGAIGVGDLTVIKDLGLKEPYVGSIALVSGEVAEDLTAYYYISEQMNTAISLGVKVEKDLSVGAAGGMFIQMLPGFDEKAVDYLETVIKDMPPITTVIDEVRKENPLLEVEGLLNKMVEYIFKDVPSEYTLHELGRENIKWMCDCSKDRLEKALISIGKKDLQEIYEEDKKAELTCQFCLKKYIFNEEELKKMLEGI